jgi:transposase
MRSEWLSFSYDSANNLRHFRCSPSLQCAVRQVNLEIVKRSDAAKAFIVLPKRWIVERKNHRLAQPLAQTGQGLGISEPQRPRIPPLALRSK